MTIVLYSTFIGINMDFNYLRTSASDDGFGVATDSNGNVYITGYSQRDLDGNANLGREDIFIAKYDTNGNKQLTTTLGSADRDIGRAITSDSNGNLYVTGSTTGVLDGSSNAGSYDVFLWKYDAADSYEVTVTAELLITIPRLTYKGNYYSAKLDHNGTCWTARDVNAVE